MRFVKLNELKPGMLSAKNIYNENGVCLLSVNKPITVFIIKQIRNMGYNGLYIHDENSAFEEFDEIISEQDRQELVKNLDSLNVDKILELTNKLVDAMLESSSFCLEFNDLRSYHNQTYQHSINVAAYSIACAISMGYNIAEIRNVGAAAMLHDIGKRGISLDILDKPAKLTPEERAIIEKHPKIGYEMLKDNELIPAVVRVSILHHHENEDGSGYPGHYKGDKIFKFAKIIHVADVYDALVSKRAYKDDYDPAEAIEYLMGNCGNMFDLDVVNVFLKNVVVYPVGTEVILSNGQEARVVKNRSLNALRPVLLGSDGNTIDLGNDPNYLSVTIIGTKNDYKVEKRYKEV
ncbi:HDIG domain-containing protein [Acetitomaculum ruminis DSM 5522]|uniref:HDIG domain-containing protein n=1 Tax=Acetitomaculum ruminis DSM 5522 TaxID=1120918 RepID=A0A1I0VU21_9FIRM|nr:HD-GYP domain-containing protein [Acetitomaculum ruminis]SFA79802.1 HDIG domain-containing protein [Acetitomaculum ruminis DSM 5522]